MHRVCAGKLIRYYKGGNNRNNLITTRRGPTAHGADRPCQHRPHWEQRATKSSAESRPSENLCANRAQKIGEQKELENRMDGDVNCHLRPNAMSDAPTPKKEHQQGAEHCNRMTWKLETKNIWRLEVNKTWKMRNFASSKIRKSSSKSWWHSRQSTPSWCPQTWESMQWVPKENNEWAPRTSKSCTSKSSTKASGKRNAPNWRRTVRNALNWWRTQWSAPASRRWQWNACKGIRGTPRTSKWTAPRWSSAKRRKQHRTNQ